ncbi:unnamed protein product [Rhizoctonia solani]|uniref:Zn(2)-C6 fungal-type domain-containing protein n=1 Tax=Rhizoctonia solani TaxID=456999 RepID=A0A8H3BU96_9AGAM|nr:unnamed protein product [Rhizoctonia solani]
MASTRSTTGCFTCKSKHKKCDETKPQCLRCQKAHIECLGYTYIQDPNKPNGKPRTLPGPRIAGRSRAPTLQTTLDLLANTGASVGGRIGKLAEDIHTLNRSAPSSANGSITHLTADYHTSHGLVVNTISSLPVQTFSETSITTSMTSGQASLLTALFSLEQPPDMGLPLARPGANPRVPLVWAPHHIEEHENNPEAVGDIRPELVLDKTAISNALPFVLQGYAALIGRIALEPQKLMSSARDFVFRHFEDGEQSRWIVGLLANVGSGIATVRVMEGKQEPELLISALSSAVRRRLATVKSSIKSTRLEQAKALDSALKVVVLHVYANSPAEAITLRREAAPIFRQICPEPPGASINLPSLLQHPLGSLPQYAYMGIICSILSDMPALFQYEVPISGNQLSNPYPSLFGIQKDGLIQWVYGIPNQVLLLFAKMKEIRQDGLIPNEETVDLLEQGIREIPPFSGSSSDRFLAVMRSVVQECWRQAAFIYLYMGVCGDPSDTPRVVEAFKRFMKLLNGTRPGRLPDDFLASPLMIVTLAAQRGRDRDVIRQRAARLNRCGQTFSTNDGVSRMVEDYWARADAEGRPIMWSDLAVSRRQVLGIY